MAIQSFSDPSAEKFFMTGELGKGIGWADVSKIVRRKLDMLHYAARINDLKAPPGNRLERLKGDLSRFFSIRINNQWRILFMWTDAGPEKVQVTDYH